MPHVVAVAARDGHGLGKNICETITLIAGEGVLGDAHRGVTVKHRSRVAKDPTSPNLRQVHLIHTEIFDVVLSIGFTVAAGDLGENITTHGIDLLALPKDTELHFPSGAAIKITGLRNPCNQINGHTAGLMQALLDTDVDGNLIRKCGVMAVVLSGGMISAGNSVDVSLPAKPWFPLQPV